MVGVLEVDLLEIISHHDLPIEVDDRIWWK